MSNQVRILLVDDHDSLRKSVRWLLETRSEFEICGEAENGAKGVEKTAELKPDVVVMNISMPVMNGFEAARRIKEISPASRIVLLSSHKDQQLLREAKEVGAVCYVSKSDANCELVDAVMAAAEGRRSAVL